MAFHRVLLLSIIVVLTGCASQTPSPEPAPWSSNELSALATELRTAHVHLTPGPDWSLVELKALAGGLNALPSMLLPTKEQPLRLARVARPCINGLGRYNAACPTFADDGTLLLYDPVLLPVGADDHRVAKLSSSEQLLVLRKRALAHGLLVRADETHRWSRDSRWRQINGWNFSGTRPKNIHPEGYLTSLGRRSAHLDFVTSAEVYFFRAAEHLDPDLSFTCQEFTRQRLLTILFEESYPGWAHRYESQDQDRPTCEAFETWADLGHIEGIDVLFASERTDRPESLFGHLLLHVRHKNTDLFRSEGFQYVYQFGAVPEADINPVEYLVQGLNGSFRTVFDLSMFRTIDHNYLQLEQRTLRRFTLRLSEDQTRRTMERIWEVERRTVYPYYFTTHNCASMLLDLLDPVFEDRHFARKFFALPTEVLDLLARARADDGKSLLIKGGGDVLSAEERAIEARGNLRRLRAENYIEPSLATLLDAILKADPPDRISFYHVLGQEFAQALRGSFGSDYRDLLLIAESLVDIERANLDRAQAERLAVNEALLLEPFQLTRDEVFAYRNSLFSHEDLARRTGQRNDFAHQMYERMRRLKRRPPTSREERVIQWHRTLLDVFDAATLAHGELLDELRRAFDDDFDAVYYLDELHQTRQASRRQLDARSLSPSNSGRLRLGLLSDATTFAPELSLHLAIVDDHLGQRRLHGHRPEVEATILGIRLKAPLSEDLLLEFGGDLTLARYISLATPRRGEGGSILRSFGWGLEVMLHSHRPTAPIWGHGFFGFFLPLFLSPSGVDHIAIGLGPRIAAGLTTSGSFQSLGAQAHLRAKKHLGGPFDNVLFLRLTHSEALTISGAFHRQGEARLGLELFLPAGSQGALLSPFLQGDLHQMTGREEIQEIRLTGGLMIEWVRLPAIVTDPETQKERGHLCPKSVRDR